ncbi:hypothetical protein MLD38_018727 [Melastoma candidum]|uniref:Uncharacterized protein n=1 Tax=Melastoma candidum TaxID=119954 RepID=A0ACB9QYR6_9MYRT|nr:hypothetical protein MLD38_018727 [Melastoma candidum]
MGSARSSSSFLSDALESALACAATSATCILMCMFPLQSNEEGVIPPYSDLLLGTSAMWMFLTIGAASMLVIGPLPLVLWCALIAPYFLLELKIHRQWLLGGNKRLCKVVNPSSHLSSLGTSSGKLCCQPFPGNISHYLVDSMTFSRCIWRSLTQSLQLLGCLSVAWWSYTFPMTVASMQP